VRQCWRNLNLEHIRGILLAKENSREFVEGVLNFEQDLSSKIFLLLWRWWGMRNKVNPGEQQLSCSVVIGDVLAMLEDQRKGVEIRTLISRNNASAWKAPEGDWLKINIDGAYCPSSKIGSWGFIARDCQGEGVLAGAGNEGHDLDALMEESIACLKALEVARHHGISHIVLETDSSLLTNAIRSNVERPLSKWDDLAVR
jgi:hypothetical protein